MSVWHFEVFSFLNGGDRCNSNSSGSHSCFAIGFGLCTYPLLGHGFVKIGLVLTFRFCSKLFRGLNVELPKRRDSDKNYCFSFAEFVLMRFATIGVALFAEPCPEGRGFLTQYRPKFNVDLQYVSWYCLDF